MTQEEVDKIYDYLHENYEYRDGELIRKKVVQGAAAGTSMGSFALSSTSNRSRITCNFTIDNKRYSMQLKHLIYIYHHKLKAKNITYADGNLANTTIENLVALETRHKCFHDENISNKKSGATGYTKLTGKKMYRVRLSTEEGRFTIGSYDDEMIASSAYQYAKDLYYKEGLSSKDIKTKTLDKFKSSIHKKCPLKGVSCLKNGKFRAYLFLNKVRIPCGTFNTPEEAHAAYLKAKAELSLVPATKEEVKEASEKVIKKYRQALDNLANR